MSQSSVPRALSWTSLVALTLIAALAETTILFPSVLFPGTRLATVATTALVGFGYIATRGWVQSTTSVVEGRASEALALVGVALNRDMKGAWTTVLVPTDLPAIEEDPPYTMRQSVARAFATFPYPESFLVWRASARGEGTIDAFNRTERWPTWDHGVPPDDPFPVAIVQDPPALKAVVAALRARPEAQAGFVSIDADIDGVPYQVVAHLLFATSEPHALLRRVGVARFWAAPVLDRQVGSLSPAARPWYVCATR